MFWKSQKRRNGLDIIYSCIQQVPVYGYQGQSKNVLVSVLMSVN